MYLWANGRFFLPELASITVFEATSESVAVRWVPPGGTDEIHANIKQKDDDFENEITVTESDNTDFCNFTELPSMAEFVISLIACPKANSGVPGTCRPAKSVEAETHQSG